MKLKLTSLAHYLGGIVAALVSAKVPTLAILITVVFVLYEFDESWKINDEAFQDIKEFLIALVIATIFILGGLYFGIRI